MRRSTRTLIEEDVLTDAVREDEYAALTAEFRERIAPDLPQDDAEQA